MDPKGTSVHEDLLGRGVLSGAYLLTIYIVISKEGQGQALPQPFCTRCPAPLPRAFGAPFNPPPGPRPTVDAYTAGHRPPGARRRPAPRDPAKPRLPTPTRCRGSAQSVPSLCRRAAYPGAHAAPVARAPQRDPPGKPPQQPPACLPAVRGTAGAKRGSGSRRAFQHTDQPGTSLAGGPRCTEPPQIVLLPR